MVKNILISDPETLAMIYSICGDEPDSVKYAIRLMWYTCMDPHDFIDGSILKKRRDEYLNGNMEVVEVK